MKILLDEDCKITILSIKKTLNKQLDKTTVLVAENGQLALNLLNSLDADSELPCFILLDLNMPVMNGIEFLSIIKKDDRLKQIPIVIHSTSSNKTDFFKCKSLGIAGYYIKHVDYNVYKNNIITIVNYWRNSFNPFCKLSLII
jgi:CheY-like chemotaxis protein